MTKQAPDAATRVGGRPSAPEAAIRLRGLIRAHATGDPRDVTSAVRHGNPAVEIRAYARGLDADLIVAGRALPASPGRFALDPGGTDRAAAITDIARVAPCPVLTIATAGEDGTVSPPPRPGVFTHIVCGVDGAAASRHGLAHAMQLAQDTAATLTVVHAGAASVAPRGVREVVAAGPLIDELMKVVRLERPDLLVLGISSPAGPGDPGSGAAAITREQVECPVLLVPHRADRP